jgi:hypothetical protein
MTQLNVLPYPAIIDYVGPELLHVLSPAIHCDNANESLLQKAAYLQQALQQRFGTSSTICEQNSSRQAPGTLISLQVVEQLQQLQQFRWREEGYQLSCGAQGIQIAALTATGVFYGIQTLLQALQATPDGLRLPYTQVCMHAVRTRLLELALLSANAALPSANLISCVTCVCHQLQRSLLIKSQQHLRVCRSLFAMLDQALSCNTVCCNTVTICEFGHVFVHCSQHTCVLLRAWSVYIMCLTCTKVCVAPCCCCCCYCCCLLMLIDHTRSLLPILNTTGHQNANPMKSPPATALPILPGD